MESQETTVSYTLEKNDAKAISHICARIYYGWSIDGMKRSARVIFIAFIITLALFSLINYSQRSVLIYPTVFGSALRADGPFRNLFTWFKGNPKSLSLSPDPTVKERFLVIPHYEPAMNNSSPIIVVDGSNPYFSLIAERLNAFSARNIMATTFLFFLLFMMLSFGIARGVHKGIKIQLSIGSTLEAAFGENGISAKGSDGITTVAPWSSLESFVDGDEYVFCIISKTEDKPILRVFPAPIPKRILDEATQRRILSLLRERLPASLSTGKQPSLLERFSLLCGIMLISIPLFLSIYFIWLSAQHRIY